LFAAVGQWNNHPRHRPAPPFFLLPRFAFKFAPPFLPPVLITVWLLFFRVEIPSHL
jgi:hypothetical protein